MHVETDSLPVVNALKDVFPFNFFKIRKSTKNEFLVTRWAASAMEFGSNLCDRTGKINT